MQCVSRGWLRAAGTWRESTKVEVTGFQKLLRDQGFLKPCENEVYLTFIENRIREKITMQEIVIIHMTDKVKGKKI